MRRSDVSHALVQCTEKASHKMSLLHVHEHTHTHTPFTTQEKTILCFYELSFVVVACLFVFQFNFTSVISRTRAIHTIQLHDEINKQNQTEKETKKRNN